MKHIKIRFILCMVFVFSSMGIIEAKPSSNNEADSLNSSKNSIVPIAYRKVLQKDLLGGISVVDVQELTKKNYNLYSLDNMQGYVGGWNGASLWGMDSYLVLIDGVPRDANNIDPTEIDKITFLKGAAAVALYGSRGAKGVVLITSKRGKVNENKIEVRANTGFYVSKSYPKYLGSAEYMTLYNEARANDGLAQQYSNEDIYNYSVGANKYRYPNINFYSEDYLKKAYNRSEMVAEISGGNARTQYYTNIGYYTQDDVFKFGEGKNNNTNRLNVRGNVDFQMTDVIKAYVNANATFYNTRTAKGNFWTSATTLRPNRFSPLIPKSYIDPKDLTGKTYVNDSQFLIDNMYMLGGTQSELTNVFADMYAAGYSQWTSRQFQFDTGLDIDLKGITKGLTFKSMVAIDYATSYTQSYDNSYAIYAPVWSSYNGSDVINSLTKYATDKKSGNQNINNSADRQTVAFSAQFDYNTTINKVHNISASLIGAGYQLTQTDYHKPTNANLALLVSYNYLSKYYVDLSATVPYSAKLAEGSRAAVSPSITLGWNLSKEKFLENSKVISNLLISASGSILNTDLDIANYYYYGGRYDQTVDWFGWYDGTSERATIITRAPNASMTYAKRNEFSANIKAGLFNDLITLDASYFVNTYQGIITRPTTLYPIYLATGNTSYLPWINYNNNDRSGFDFSLNINKKLGDVSVSLGVNATYNDNKVSKLNELYQYSYQNRTGKAIDAIWGLKCLGYYNATEVAAIDGTPAHPKPVYGGVKPGDLKYLDVNGDGAVDEKDEVFLGRNGQFGNPWIFGANLTVKYKNFTFFALATGGSGSYALKNSAYFWVYGEGKYSEVARGRWTPATAATATFPRLTTLSGSNNFRTSDYWMYSTDRLNISKVQLTYDFPAKMFKGSFVHNISAYVSGSDLLTISKEQTILEMNTTSAPQTRFYNLGFKVTF
jgi:TonB-linked SusC/RagA family outer membrane protein